MHPQLPACFCAALYGLIAIIVLFCSLCSECGTTMQVGFRWAGQANIALAVEPIVSLGTLLRMVPKVSNLRVGAAPGMLTACLHYLAAVPVLVLCMFMKLLAVSQKPLHFSSRHDSHFLSYASVQMLTWLLCVLVQMSGVWRIVMKPLIDDVPVVAGMVIAMKAPPQVADAHPICCCCCLEGV